MDSALDFLSPLSSVPGLGPRRLAALAEYGMHTAGDLLHWLPRRYVDRSTITPLCAASGRVGTECTVIGEITRARVERGRRQRMRILLEDGTGSLEALWFQGMGYLRTQLAIGRCVMLTGTISRYTILQMVHPQVEVLAEGVEAPARPFLPRYRVGLAMREAGIGQKTLLSAIEWTLDHVRFPSRLPPAIEHRHNLPPLELCLRTLHSPRDLTQLASCRARLVYEQLYELAVNMRLARRTFATPGVAMRGEDMVRSFTQSLPFVLTPGQSEALKVLLDDAAQPSRMHRLLQGDVGCGKTVVAFAACLPALASGRQVAWMAPTEILAQQTFTLVRSWLEPLGVHPQLLTGATPAAQKRETLADLKSAQCSCVVGTHALLQKSVEFTRLGMIVIDEQHRFGVEQRLALQQKAPQADFLLMSATPIPQSLAQTVYGDLDAVTIRGMPPGRQTVTTRLVPHDRRAGLETFVAVKATEGAQAFWVVPRIESDEDDETVTDIQSTVKALARGALKRVATQVIHGQMTAQSKQTAIDSFAGGTARLLVATSVVEVGIDAPGAAVIVVENAERFGLAQLHQLRGRVGRRGQEAWCFLLSELADTDPQVQSRLKEFCQSHDGFAIAELDLRLRGPGQAMGAGQSGWDDPGMSVIMENLELFRKVQVEVDELVGRAEGQTGW